VSVTTRRSCERSTAREQPNAKSVLKVGSLSVE
jgi:hypothetical protein